MEQKNFLMAMGLIVAFLLIWSTFVVPRFVPPPAPVTATDASPNLTKDSGQGVVSTPSEMKSAHAEKGQEVVLPDMIFHDENNEIVFSSKGGGIKAWRLNAKGQEVDLVLNPEETSLPLSTFPEAVFKITPGNQNVVMRAVLENGLIVKKTLTLSPTGHLHQFTFEFENPTAHPIDLKSWEWGWAGGLGTTDVEKKENTRLTRALTAGKLKVHKLPLGEQAETGPWVALDNRYFLVAIIQPDNQRSAVTITGSTDPYFFGLFHSQKITGIALQNTTLVPAHETISLGYELYAGPKGFTQLQKYGKGLEDCVDFGVFAPLGRFILRVLYHLKAVTGNYGVSIILLTMGIQLLMSPLTIKSFKATLAMKKLQPKIAEIQARFKSDPKRLNVEMMNVYKSTGTNPFGGCLPMLLQLPIFWALFTTLRNAYELRGAPFVGWIHDLSTPDILFHLGGGFPVHALPLVMGGAMFFQQRMSGAASDPTQKQMMTMMPIMFTFMFYGFPSGLVLYWLTNNLMTMAFQMSFQKFSQQPSAVVETTIVK